MSGRTTALKPGNAVRGGSLSHRSNIFLGGGAVVFAALAVYHNCFTVPFLMDDVSSIVQNPSIRHLWPIWRALSPSPTSLVGGRPVVSLSLALNYLFGGLAVWGYHAVNLAIHLLAGLTLYGIVRWTLLQPSLRERFSACAIWLALAVAVLWTVHPLQTETVTYISERCESLMGLFYLLTLYCFIRGTQAHGSTRWFALSVLACLLGMASKEVMVTAPLMVLLYDRTFLSGSFREAWARHWRLYAGLASTWVLLGYLMVGLHYRGAGYGLGISWWAYALIECRVVVRYLWLAIWPHPLVFDYGPTVPIQHVAESLPYALVLAVAVGAVLVELKRRPVIGFVAAWFFVILAPTSSVIPLVGEPMAESRMYLPLAAAVSLVVMGIYALMGRRSVAVFLALAAGLGLLTVQRNEDYRDEISIWSDTLAKCPDNVRAHQNLGNALYQLGRRQEAIGQYEKALQIRPDYAQAHYGLGLALWQAGQLQEAIGHYEQALRINPDLEEAHVDLGIALSQVGSNQDALVHFMEALRLRPDSPDVHCNLGLALFQAGRVSEAVEQFEQALRIDPDYAPAEVNLGNTFLQIGRAQEAVPHYEQALRINPDYAEAHANLGATFQRMGKLQEAAAEYEQALRSKPDYVEAHFNLGLTLEKLGREREAIDQFEQALKLRPDFTAARNALHRVQIAQ